MTESTDNTQSGDGPGRPRKRKWVVLVVSLVVLGIAFGIYQGRWSVAFRIRRSFPASRHGFLFDADYGKLLQACRKEIAGRQQYQQTLREGEAVPGYVSPAYDDPRLPVAIRSFHAEPIVITPNKLRADLYRCTGSCAHYWFVAFAEGVEPSSPDDLIDTNHYSHPPRNGLHDGALRIIPGLWYYDTRLVGEPRLRDLVARHFAAQNKQKRDEQTP